MKRTLLHLALLSALVGTASTLQAQSVAPPVTAKAPTPSAPTNTPSEQDGSINCTGDTCVDTQGPVFILRTRSYSKPVTEGTDQRSSSAALQPDRRVTIANEAPGKAVVAGKFSMTLPNGGVIWATEDPNLGQPELTISAPSFVPFDGQRITTPVQFATRSNYPAFIKRMEITLYRGTDGDLIEPIATIPLDVAGVSEVHWDGVLPAKYRFRAGDELIYVLRAYGDDGNFDETYSSKIQLVTPEEAAHGNQTLRDSAEKALGSALSESQAQTQSLIDNVFAGNGLRQQNIPIYGSRVRIQGRNVPSDRTLSINGEPYPVDLERKFVAEYLVPVGHHSFDVTLLPVGTPPAAPGEEGHTPVAGEQHQRLDIDVSGKYFFGVALADVTMMQNSISGSIAPFTNDSRYKDDIITDGRLAFYMKAKVDAKYLITAQADTTEQDIGKLFTGFTSATPQDVFRRLDPDLYYPTYGDDSTTYRDVDTMGRFYFRVDWDKNQALWGNYTTGFTGTEYAQYVRSLYGAAAVWRSRANNAWADPKTELRAFGSQSESAAGHNEFIGTGGSLYYLKNADILPGSDQLVIEVRDPTTGRVANRIPLQRGADYQIDEMQGRILLTKPLAQFTRENVTTLTRDAPQDGFEQRLIVDYEWVPTGFDDNNVTAGVRGKQWFGDHVGVGVTYVNEDRDGQDYNIKGGDLTLQAGKGTYLKTEYTHTDSFGVPVYQSTNGGFSFFKTNDTTANRSGDAKAVEARANLKELGWTTEDWSAGAWWRETSSGYSTGRYDTGLPVKEYGAEVLGQFTPALGMYARWSRAESGTDSLVQAQGTLEWRIDDVNTLSGEIRRVEETTNGSTADGLLGAIKYDHRFGTSLDMYGLAQFTLDNDGGKYKDNDAYVVGGKYLFGNLSSVSGEVSSGDRGDAANLTGEYKLSQTHSIYGGYTWSTDTTEYPALFDTNRPEGWTVGQRWRLTDQTNLFNESQFLKEPDQSGLAHTFGMDFYPLQGWNIGFTLQKGDLTNEYGGKVNRRAISVSGGHTSPVTDWQSKVEWRKDSGAEQRDQWVTTNRFNWKINESWRIAAKLNYSDTDDSVLKIAGARFAEGNLGVAWRPWNSERWSLFGRYTYLYDLGTLAQDGAANYDQRSQIFSLEGVYKYSQHWEYALKAARRDGEVRMGRLTGPWFDSGTNFFAAQVRYELRTKWHALAEYRWLDVDQGGSKQGVLVGLDRDISKNFRVGVGYNFTDFSDDLTNFDYNHKGWFINITGTY